MAYTCSPLRVGPSLSLRLTAARLSLAGSWARLPDLPALTGRNHSAGPPGHVTLNHKEGRFDMQLYMNSIADVSQLSLVYGYFKLLDGSHSSERDIYSVAKGEGGGGRGKPPTGTMSGPTGV